MIAKGKSCNHTGNLARYLLEKRDNETTVLRGTSGTLATDLLGSLQEMEELAKLTDCKNFLYHLSVRPKDGEHFKEEQKERIIEAYAKGLGLEGHQCAIVEHVKNETAHLHLVFSRIDPETLKATRMSWNYAKHEEITRALEKEFGLEHVAGKFARDPDEKSPNYSHGHKEAELARAAGFQLAAWEKEVRRLQGCTSGKEFMAELENLGGLLAKGESVKLMIVDPSGNYHRAAQTAGLRVKELNALLADIDRAKLPTVEQAQALQRLKRDKITNPAQEVTTPREWSEQEQAFKKSYIAARDLEHFKEEFARRGYTLHRADDQSPIVALDKDGRIFPLDRSNLEDCSSPAFMKSLDGEKLSSVDREMQQRAEDERAAQPVAIAPEKSVGDRVKEIKKENTPKQYEPHIPRYLSQSMAANQNSATQHHKQNLRRKKEAAVKATERETRKLATERLERVTASQVTAPPKTAEQLEAERETVRAYYENKRAEAEREAAAKREKEIKEKEAAAARELVARVKAEREAKRAAEAGNKVQEKPQEQQQKAAQELTKRREEERRETTQRQQPRPTQAQAQAAHKAATTEQTDDKQKSSVFDRLYSVGSKGGKQNPYDYDRER